EVARTASLRLGRAVTAGPFAGMELLPNFEVDSASPVLKLLGLYESHLDAAVEEAIARRPLVVANIGCADGYYAVGLARRLPDATVPAYDLAHSARTGTAELAQLNGVSDRVRIHGRCRVFPPGVGLVVCDIEGGESGLLRDVDALHRAALIVETHDHAV